MSFSLDHAVQELMSAGYIRRLEKEELYEFALKARDELETFFSVLGGRPVFDTEVDIIGLRRMTADAIEERAERLQSDSATGLFRGQALSFNRAVILWFFRKQLDSDLDAGAERTWLTLEEAMRGVAAFYPEEVKEDEAKFTRALKKTLSFLVNIGLVEEMNSSRGTIWSAHPSLRVALGADEMEDFTLKITETLEKFAAQRRKDAAEGRDPMAPDHPDSPWSVPDPGDELDDEDDEMGGAPDEIEDEKA